MKNFFGKMGWTSIITSLVFVILGFIIAYNPNTTFQIISYLIGGALIIFGIIKIIKYLKTKDFDDLSNYELTYGIISILLGIVAIVCSRMIESILRILVGIWIIYSAIIRINLALKIQKDNAENRTWIPILLISILMLICGIYIIANPGAVMMTIGVIMVIYGIIDIIEEIIFIRKVKDII